MRIALRLAAGYLILSLLVAQNLAQAAPPTCDAGNPLANAPVRQPQVDYTVHGNGTVTHNKTGLMWKVCLEGQTWSAGACSGSMSSMSWSAALTAAKNSSFAGHTDWRVPNVKELTSIVERCGYNPAINGAIFPGAAGNGSWTGTSKASNTAHAWLVSFYTGYTDNNLKVSDFQVRLVRGGQLLDTFDLLNSDITPDVFSFTAQTGVALSSVATSNTITVAGLGFGQAAISVANGEFAVNGGAYGTAASEVSNGDNVAVRLTASGSYSTLTTASVTIGTLSANFDVTTLMSAPTAPGAPTSVVGTPGNAQIALTFVAPSPGTLAGGAAATITGYTADCGGTTQAGAGSPIVVTGLTNGTPYACTVTATNDVPLTGPAGTAASVTPATVPDAPGAPTATLRPRAAALSFVAGGNGGVGIDQYKAVCTSSDGGSPATTYGSASPFTVGLLTAGKTYTCVVAAHNAAGWGSDSPASGSFLVPATALAILPDSGQTTCYDGFNLVACTSANTGDAAPFPRQDARYGRDAAAMNGELSKTGGGAAGFDYTALDASGNATTPSSGVTPHPCVRDNLTGLVWEVKTDDGGPHDKDHTYTWYSSNAATNGGNAGGLGTDTCAGSLGANCNTEALANAVNAAGWCGFNDWRIPSVRELQSLVHAGTFGPSIEGTYFPNSQSSYYWSGAPYAPDLANAWLVNFNFGPLGAYYKTDPYYARLVRGGQ